jgi:glutathione S-transferase
MLELTAIAFSPWSEKARWALDHHRCDYRELAYEPIVGEYVLRWQMRRPFGRLTVPVLRDGDRWLTDSFNIARHAESIGRGSPLFPEHRLEEIGAWNRRSEAALAAGRAILMRSWGNTRELAIAALPDRIPEPLKPLFLPIGRQRLRAFMARYSIREGDLSPEAMLTAELDALEQALDGRRYLLDDGFTYADVAMALTLQQVQPVDPRYIVRMAGLGPAGMNVPELESRYAGLIAWRDDLYARHRRPRRRHGLTRPGRLRPSRSGGAPDVWGEPRSGARPRAPFDHGADPTNHSVASLRRRSEGFGPLPWASQGEKKTASPGASAGTARRDVSKSRSRVCDAS